jgi:hypothetical protein
MIEVWGHRQVLLNAGYEIIGPPLLVPDEEYPGVFQVWWPVNAAEPQFLWVSPDGVTIRQDVVTPEHLETP